MKTIYEVLAYGPIVASNEELGLVVTFNAAYYNLWSATVVDGHAVGFTNVDVMSHSKVFNEHLVDIIAEAEAWVDAVLKEESEEVKDGE